MKPPIFILGCQRSGSSLLRRILDSHTNIACPPESSFFVQLAGVCEVKRALQGLLNMGFAEEDVLEQMRDFTVHFFERYALSKGKRRWADKTPHYLNHAETIDGMFQGEVLYIGIVRHGLDVAYSLCDYNWGILTPYMDNGTEKPVAAIRFWRDQNLKLLNFQQKVTNRFYMVRYEELTELPEKVLRPMFDFLDETWEENVLQYNSFQHDSGFEDEKVSTRSSIVVNSGKFHEWPPELQKRLFLEGEEMLTRLNYSL